MLGERKKFYVFDPKNTIDKVKHDDGSAMVWWLRSRLVIKRLAVRIPGLAELLLGKAPNSSSSSWVVVMG